MLVMAHRGATATAPENSVAAFEAAVAHGADGVELDVRRTRDGRHALAHDEELVDGRRIVELDRADVPAEIPDLHSALEVCRPLRVVNIEIKNWPEDGDFDPALGLADQVVDVLRARGELDDGRSLLSSFHLPTIDRVRELAPQLATGWLLGLFDDPAPLVERAAAHGHGAVHPHHVFVDARLVALAHDSGLAVNTWTCNEPDRIRELADLGVDAVITDVPDVALRALGR